MHTIVIVLYFFLCLVLGIAGRGTRVGGIGIFLLAVLFTPLLVGLILAILRPLPKPKVRRPSSQTY